jgi:hypothetical protein
VESQVAQDRYRWRAVVNTVMDLRVLAPRIQLVNTTLLTSYLACTTLDGNGPLWLEAIV